MNDEGWRSEANRTFFVCWLVISQNGLLGRLKLIPVCQAKGSSAKKKIVKGFKPGPLVM